MVKIAIFKTLMWLAGHIKVQGGPYVARGPEVAQAWSIRFATRFGANKVKRIVFNVFFNFFN